jgi:kynurenine formamidase
MSFVDLSVKLDEFTPVYPGDPETSIKPAGVLSRDGFCDHLISVGTHVGTHIDAPMHMLQNAKSIDSFSLDKLIGKGQVIDISSSDYSEVLASDLEQGGILLLHSGRIKDYHDATYFTDYPVMSEQVIEYIISKKPMMVGIDACSFDKDDNFPVHKKLLSSEILLIENLANLDKLFQKEFRVYAIPLKLTVDASPARVFAEVHDEAV